MAITDPPARSRSSRPRRVNNPTPTPGDTHDAEQISRPVSVLPAPDGGRHRDGERLEAEPSSNGSSHAAPEPPRGSHLQVPLEAEQPFFDLVCEELGYTPAGKSREISEGLTEYDQLLRAALTRKTPGPPRRIPQQVSDD